MSANGRTAISDTFAKLARTALIYPVRFVGSTATDAVEFSPKIYALNVLAMVAFVICGFGSLLGEVDSFRMGNSVHFKNLAVVVVACLNYNMMVLPTAIAVFGSASRQAAWLDIERLLDGVDEALDNRGCTAADKLVERCAILLIGMNAVLFAVDYYIWLTINPSNKSYGIVYVFHYFNLVSMAVYAQLAWCIGRRFDNVNREIEAKLERMTTLNRVEFVNRQYHNLSDLLRCSDNRIKDVKYIPIQKFQEMYWSLYCSVNILNHQYGWQLLASLLLNIMNLIAFPNILITTISSSMLLEPFIYTFSIVYIIWFFSHLAYLLLMVLPSSYAASKAERTAVSICKYLDIYLVPDDMKQLELFVHQLQNHKLNFSICGIVDLKRSTITKVIGTIITYLVIFIQLQNK